MDEKVDAPVDVYSLTREELQVLVESQRQRIKRLEGAIEGAGKDIERAKATVNDVWLYLQQRTER